jgi:hypothetical protein
LCGGADNGGESNYNGRHVIRGPSFGGVGQRISIVSSHGAAAVINNKDVDNDLYRSGGRHAPPPLVHPVLPDAACCHYHKGVWGVVIRGVEEEGPHRCNHLSGSDPTRGG